jgi:hypothetical protein
MSVRTLDKLEKFRALPAARRRVLLEALLALAAARSLTLLMPFRHYSRWLGQPGAGTPAASLPPDTAQIAGQITWALAAAGANVPWDAPCLARAVAGKWMLRRRGIPSTLYLGAARDQNDLTFHAWLRAGDCIVTGESEARRHAVVASFS